MEKLFRAFTVLFVLAVAAFLAYALIIDSSHP